MTINLTPDIENALADEAKRQGTTLETLALDCLRARFLSAPTEKPQQGSLADLWADGIGVLSSSEHVPGGARMSEQTGKKFTDILVEKRQQGRL